jgi:hypothetical protein
MLSCWKYNINISNFKARMMKWKKEFINYQYQNEKRSIITDTTIVNQTVSWIVLFPE